MSYHTESWLRNQVEKLGRTSKEIADEFGVSKSTIKYYVAKFGIKSPNPPHTRKGRFLGEKSSLWKGGTHKYTYNWSDLSEQFRRISNYTCNNCGKHPEKSVDLHVHHIDENKKNNSPFNIEVLCRSCHSFRHPKRTKKD